MANQQREKDDREALLVKTMPPVDHLYHLGLHSNMPLADMFGDIKFVCLGGTAKRMHDFALLVMRELGIEHPVGRTLEDISAAAHRYSIYKAGPVLSVSHGMGMPSISILLNELFKLMHHAKCKDVIFLRIGTSGGIGVTPGTVVISGEVVDALQRPSYEMIVMGKQILYPALLDRDLAEEILVLAREHFPSFQPVIGKTMCTDDFYNGQGRLDGAFCDYTAQDKFAYLEELVHNGVSNIEMESLAFAALCRRSGFKGAVICVTLLDRTLGDQITTETDTLNDFQLRPQMLAALFIRKRLGHV